MTTPIEKTESEQVLTMERLESQSDMNQVSRKIETRVKRIIDFSILPLLASVYFLAQMVSFTSDLDSSGDINDHVRVDLISEMQRLRGWMKSLA